MTFWGKRGIEPSGFLGLPLECAGPVEPARIAPVQVMGVACAGKTRGGRRQPVPAAKRDFCMIAL
jgi:hypothetical protein